MAQIFHPSTNVIAKASIIGGVLFLGTVGAAAYRIEKSPLATQADTIRNQPVPFSHEHHVRGLGIDCRYCHTSVEDSNFAGLPPTKTCMTCHSQIWTNAEVTRPIRESWATNQPIPWTRVHNLAGFVYFNHGIHVNKGVGCSTCHGRVDEMPLMYQVNTLQMTWCLECHRDPEKFVRPREQVFNMAYDVTKDSGRPQKTQEELGPVLVKEYGIDKHKAQLTNCSICHR
jgi:hypothetical protein